MALHSILASASQLSTAQLAGVFLFVPVLLTLATIFYRLGPLYPLSGTPGPLLPRLTGLPILYHAYIGDEAKWVHSLHERYGAIVRLAPNWVDFRDVRALHPIYHEKGGFAKASHYRNFDVDGHATIFSNTIHQERSLRAKAVIQMFSVANCKKNAHYFKASLSRFIEQCQRDKESGRVQMLDLARGMGIDAVTEYLFGISFDGLREYADASSKLDAKCDQPPRMSASAFVDAFTASSRLLYCSKWLYTLADRIDGFFFPNPELPSSAASLESFTRIVMANARTTIDSGNSKTSETSETFPVRLLRAGFSPAEVAAQCKDIMFAATDTLGMNISTACFMLAKFPETYQKLSAEIEAATIKSDDDIHQLPYLNAVVRETLRMSMTNPCEFPRQVGASGWAFDNVFYPPGTTVSCSATEMHFYSGIYEDAFAFKPERWLHATEIMQKALMSFGVGSRQCIAKGMSLWALNLVIYEVAKENILGGLKVSSEKIELLEGFSSRVVGGSIDLVRE
ncbi:uncharacterized protein TRUGW13939_00831 [Talaromyces rugulosus]|uniref:Cytochrome P450 n=1 Tax=Talaromyces rugulosus TaxID=121627 RepID=A0A7H8QJL2_TALRU|nr:uncharacterized protein TRUGW13939_00831 [Talaromyces rugulosus]QKX53751.1 hypothetical protein TRUGW13939_00831 [Talaromyces rugulosus]